MNIPRDRALHCSTTVTSYTTPQDHSVSICFPFIQCLFLSLFILSFHLPLLLSASLFYFQYPLSISGLCLTVPPKPTLSARVIDEKGERVQKFNYTDMLETERERWGVRRKRNRRKKKQHHGEVPLTEVQLALLRTKDVIILFKITSEKLAIKRFITLRVTTGREALFMILLEQILLNI